MAPGKVVLCTGANQGLGYAVLSVAGLRQPESIYILASRDLAKGREAAKSLQESGVKAQIDVIQLDVLKDEEIISAVSYVEQKYSKLDILINNSGIIRIPQSRDLAALRSTFNEILSTNLTSVGIVTTAFTPLLYKSTDPKVINISSGLGSCQNSLTKKMGRHPLYGASKIGLNGLSVHLQVAENDRIEIEGESAKPRIRYYVCAPGALKTAFSNFRDGLRLPERGAEVIVHLLADDERLYEGGSYWEYEEGEMRHVPW
ncbi:short chain dehydrogenase/reductase family protein [Nemania serpens]|nr:short chain dehydrogenase/reductase family protein [Nemania serpens]